MDNMYYVNAEGYILKEKDKFNKNVYDCVDYYNNWIVELQELDETCQPFNTFDDAKERSKKIRESKLRKILYNKIQRLHSDEYETSFDTYNKL